MKSVFLSYAREDATAVRKVAERLGKLGFDIWFDENIRTGDKFDSKIFQKLETCDVAIVFWSENSSSSPWVLAEAAIGKFRDVLAPVRLDETDPPAGFGAINTVSLAGKNDPTKHPKFRQLVSDVRAISRRSNRRRFHLEGAIAFLLFAIFGAVSLALLSERIESIAYNRAILGTTRILAQQPPPPGSTIYKVPIGGDYRSATPMFPVPAGVQTQPGWETFREVCVPPPFWMTGCSPDPPIVLPEVQPPFLARLPAYFALIFLLGIPVFARRRLLVHVLARRIAIIAPIAGMLDWLYATQAWSGAPFLAAPFGVGVGPVFIIFDTFLLLSLFLSVIALMVGIITRSASRLAPPD